MFSSISLFCYLNQSWAAGWIHSHCDVFAPPFLASLKSKSTFHCSFSRIFESKDNSEAESEDEAKSDDEAEDTEAANGNPDKKRAYVETTCKLDGKTIRIQINKAGAPAETKIGKCRTCHQEFANAKQLRHHVRNRPPTCSPSPPHEWEHVDASSGSLWKQLPYRNWRTFRNQAYACGPMSKDNSTRYWQCILYQLQGCTGTLIISNDDRVMKYRPCNLNHFEYNVESTGTLNCQTMRLVSDFVLHPMPDLSLL